MSCTPVTRHLRRHGVALGKRVEAFGGGKNHLVVMPDTDLEFAADAAVSSTFGAAGQRCMAVAVGGIGDRLVEAIRRRAAELPVGNFSDASGQLGPVISPESRARLSGTLIGRRRKAAAPSTGVHRHGGANDEAGLLRAQP